MITGTVPGGKVVLFNLIKGGTTSFTVPAGKLYHLLWVAGNYTADATVVTRTFYSQVTMINTDGMLLSYTQPTASSTKWFSYNVAVDSPLSPQDSTHGLGNPLILYPGHKYEVLVANGVAGDTWKAEGIYLITPLVIP